MATTLPATPTPTPPTPSSSSNKSMALPFDRRQRFAKFSTRHVTMLVVVVVVIVYLLLITVEGTVASHSVAIIKAVINENAAQENNYVAAHDVHHRLDSQQGRGTLITTLNKSTSSPPSAATTMPAPTITTTTTTTTPVIHSTMSVSAGDRASRLTRRATQFTLPQEYFEQLNAQNHKPKGPLQAGDTRHAAQQVSIRPEASGNTLPAWNTFEPRSASSGESSVKYYSLYSRPPGTLPTTSTPTTTTTTTSNSNDPNPPFVYFYPPSMNLSQESFQPNYKRSPPSSRGQHSQATNNAKLLEEIYKQDLTEMSSKLNNAAGSTFAGDKYGQHSLMKGEEPTDSDEETGMNDEEDRKYVNLTNLAEEDDEQMSENPINYKLNDHHHHHHQELNEYREAYSSGEEKVYHLSPASAAVAAATPKLARQFEGRSAAIPIRLQAAHSHPVPHTAHYYTMAHAPIEADHHHYLSAEKSTSWLGSGLAAGILIGAIPFGIMMASMMPTLLTSTVPIVNTAAVGKRRKRSVDFKNLLFDQALETVSMLMRKGLAEVTGTAKRRNNGGGGGVVQKEAQSSANVLEQFQNVVSYVAPEEPEVDTFKLMSRYMLAAVDEPKCIKEMVCSLLAEGRRTKTSPWQKTLYLMVKWMPKDIEKSLAWITGLNELFAAVRRNACLATYKCREKRMIDELRKRSRSTKRSAR